MYHLTRQATAADHSCMPETSPLYIQFRILGLTENIQLTALKKHQARDANDLSSLHLILTLGERHVLCDDQ